MYVLPVPVAIIEAKDQMHSVRSGIQQGLDYGKILDIPSVFSSNGEGFLFHDKTASGIAIETELSLDEFPSPAILWDKYKSFKGITTKEQERIISEEYFTDGSPANDLLKLCHALNIAIQNNQFASLGINTCCH